MFSFSGGRIEASGLSSGSNGTKRVRWTISEDHTEEQTVLKRRYLAYEGTHSEAQSHTSASAQVPRATTRSIPSVPVRHVSQQQNANSSKLPEQSANAEISLEEKYKNVKRLYYNQKDEIESLINRNKNLEFQNSKLREEFRKLKKLLQPTQQLDSLSSDASPSSNTPPVDAPL